MEAPDGQRRHSGIGIASFIISIAAGLLSLVVVAIAGYMEASTPGGIDEESLGAVAVGLSMMATFGASLLALGLGVGGLFQKQRKKIFAILGTVISAATAGTLVLIMVLGMLSE